MICKKKHFLSLCEIESVKRFLNHFDLFENTKTQTPITKYDIAKIHLFIKSVNRWINTTNAATVNNVCIMYFFIFKKLLS